MDVDLLLLPSDLRSGCLLERTVVVFDVLRATTTMTAALHAGVKEIRVFGSIQAACGAADAFDGPKLLCGEIHGLKPPGFDLGNSPGAFGRAEHKDRVIFMSTTNGTRAIRAAESARVMLVGSIVNAGAVARALRQIGMPVTLLCSGTDGAVAMEDVLGAGAVIDRLSKSGPVTLQSDVARIAQRLFAAAQSDLLSVLADSQGGRNVISVGFSADIAFAARLDSMSCVGEVAGNPLAVRRWIDDLAGE